MNMTIKDYCDKKGIGVRYIQRLIKQNNNHALLKENWGITGSILIGKTYLITVKKNYFKNNS